MALCTPVLKSIGHSVKKHSKSQPEKLFGYIKCNKGNNITKESKNERPSPAHCISNYAAGYFHDGNGNFADGIQNTDGNKHQSFFKKKKNKKTIEKTQVFEKPVQAEFIILKVLLEFIFQGIYFLPKVNKGELKKPALKKRTGLKV